MVGILEIMAFAKYYGMTREETFSAIYSADDLKLGEEDMRAIFCALAAATLMTIIQKVVSANE
jgi:hypothetical protein